VTTPKFDPSFPTKIRNLESEKQEKHEKWEQEEKGYTPTALMRKI
jgi:hypothetical protein